MPSFDLPSSVFLQAASLFPTPFYLYDEGGIRAAMRALKSAFAWCPNYIEYFAVKALPNPHILNVIREEGGGLDCAAETELMLAQRCGFPGERIMLSANAMPGGDFEYARKLGAYINLDDATHVDFLERHGGVPSRVLLRFNPGNLIGHDNAIMGAPAEAKFGMTRAQLSETLMKLKARGVQAFGLHAFLSSNTLTEAYYPALARLLFETGRALMQESGLKLFMVDLSGGVGIPYRPNEKPVDIAAVGEGVRCVYEDVFGDPRVAGVCVASELGRYITGPYGFLLSHVIHEKRIYKHYIGLDACAANLLRPAMYGAYHHITVAGKENEPVCDMVDITGSLCENNDKFAVDRMMPCMEIGDLVVIHDAGAHSFSMGYNYNGKLRSAEVLRRLDGSFQLIRRAEKPEDYFATLID